MERPTAEDIRALSKADFESRSYAVAEPDPLADVVDESIDYIEHVTWRTVDDTLPPKLDRVMRLAIMRRTEQTVMQGQDENVETAGDIDLIQSFSAGSYTETRWEGPTGRASATGLPRINPWPTLNDLIWQLLSLVRGETNNKVDERREYWMYMFGKLPNIPAWDIVEVGWQDPFASPSWPLGLPLPPGV